MPERDEKIKPIWNSIQALYRGGEKEIRTLVGVLALTRFPVLSRRKFKTKQMKKLYIGI